MWLTKKAMISCLLDGNQ